MIPLTDQIVDRGTDLKWRCIWGGTSPTISWYRNSVELVLDDLDADDRSRFSFTDTALNIQNVKATDSGMYQCGATNTYGSRFSSAQLKVLGEFL